MTWRCVWDVPGTPFPAWVDHNNEASAHLFALRKSREIAAEVAVIEIHADFKAATGPRSDVQPSGVVLGANEGDETL